jgi:hypothetical protein
MVKKMKQFKQLFEEKQLEFQETKKENPEEDKKKKYYRDREKSYPKLVFTPEQRKKMLENYETIEKKLGWKAYLSRLWRVRWQYINQVIVLLKNEEKKI